MNKSNWIILGILIAFVAIGFFIRVYYPYDRILGGDVVKFSSIDAYYYMRLVDNIAYNFPHLTAFDPYFSFPAGATVNTVHFFAVIVGFFAWLFSLGNVTPEIIDKVGVFVPPVMAMLTVIPLFFIGKTLFNKWAGLLACCLFVILPGELMGRSILGFTDHHIFEVLLSTTIIMFILFANKTEGWKRFLAYSFSAGILLGVYLLTWTGGMLLVFLLALYVFIQFVVNQYKRNPSLKLFQMSFILFAVGYLIYSQIKAPAELQTIMALIPAGLVALYFWGKWIKRFEIHTISIVVVVAGVMIMIWGVNNDMWNSIMGHLSAFIPNSSLTTIEAQPMFSPVGEFTVQLAWGGFTTCIFILPIPIGMIIWKYYKSKDTNLLLLIVFTLGMFWAMVAQRRFSYYMAIFLSILIGYFSWRIVAFVNEKFLADRKVMKKRKKKQYDYPHLITVGITLSVVLVGLYLPNYFIAKEVSKQSIYNPSTGWQESLEWMRDNTPKPLEDGVYYETFDDYEYPDSAYGVLSWWDYGYWITRIAHRIPYVNPTQEAQPVKDISNYLMSQETQVPIDDSDYLILDYAMSTDKIHAIIKWAGNNIYDYFETYYLVTEQGEIKRVWIYYPEYYKSLCVRLYNFGGKKVDNIQPIVIRYIDGYDNNGNYIKQIVQSQIFESYEEAQEFIDTAEEGTYRIVGVNRFVSPIPLEELEGYELVHQSENTVKLDEGAVMPEIVIFKYGG